MEHRSSYSSRIIIGVILVLLGLGFLLGSLGLWNFGQVLSQWWPLILVMIGLVQLADGSRRSGLILTIVGLLLQLIALGVLDVSFWALFWPTILILIGVSFLFSHDRPLPSSAESTSEYFVAFGGLEKKIESKDYRGGNITALFGAVELDLRDAEIADGAVLHVFTAFGGSEVWVPKNCRVVADGFPVFGGWSNKAIKPEGKNPPTLYVKGTSLFGGIEVKN